MQDLSGRRFGRLTVVGFAEKRLRKGNRRRMRYYWRCRCDCGEEKSVEAQNLKGGEVASCGCLRQEVLARSYSRGGESRRPEYGVWKGMVRRCYSPKALGFKNYGGRGIGVCEDWQEYSKFLRDMGPRPSAKHSLDRIDNDGNYEPGNCRWATKIEQDNNRRTNRPITFNGETMSIADWARRLGIRAHSISSRLQRGWTIEQALTKQGDRHTNRRQLGMLSAEQLKEFYAIKR